MNYQDCVAAAVANDKYPSGDGLRLADTNINPMTGLATDYLNHFNEAIMLLDMLSIGPEFRDDLLSWEPMSYREHFAASHFKSRRTTIAAYENADPCARACLDALTRAMTAVLEATRAALRADLPPVLARALADKAAGILKPLVARAGAVINGEAHIDGAQAAIDDLLMKV